MAKTGANEATRRITYVCGACIAANENLIPGLSLCGRCDPGSNFIRRQREEAARRAHAREKRLRKEAERDAKRRRLLVEEVEDVSSHASGPTAKTRAKPKGTTAALDGMH